MSELWRGGPIDLADYIEDELENVEWDKLCKVVEHEHRNGHVVGLLGLRNDTQYYFDIRNQHEHEVPSEVYDKAERWYSHGNGDGHYFYIDHTTVERVSGVYEQIYKGMDYDEQGS